MASCVQEQEPLRGRS